MNNLTLKMKSLTHSSKFWLYSLCALMLLPSQSHAVQLPKKGGKLFEPIIKLMQDTADFFEGPLILFVAFVTIVLAIFAWAWAPDNRLLATLFRIVIAVAIIFNLGVLFIALGK